MARGKTLTRLLDELRAEARLSLNPAHNTQVRDSQVMLLQREQERLWEDFAWPHLRVERYIPVSLGQRYYDPEGALDEPGGVVVGDVSPDRIERIQFKSDGEWMPVRAGIGAPHYAAHDSALDARAWPVSSWRIVDDEIEVWPIPDIAADVTDESGYMKIIGIRNLQPLVADADRADLDNRLLTLYAAGSLLAASGAKDAQLKLEAANKLYGKLKGSQMKASSFRMFGVGARDYPRRPVIMRYRPPVV